MTSPHDESTPPKAKPFPADATAAPTELAENLAAVVPEQDRAAAVAVIRDRILTKELLRGSRDTAQETYDELAEALQAATPAARLGVVDAMAFRAEVSEHRRLSLALAIARFSLDHSDLTTKAQAWVDGEVTGLLALGVDGIQAACAHRLEQLESWAADVQAKHPDVWTSYRSAYMQAKRNLESARSGTFTGAQGSLYNFLVDAGQSPQRIDKH